MTKENWQHIYDRGEQLNQYPFDFIVSQFFKLKSQSRAKQFKVLDLGCGAGNHAIFCAENGAHVHAVDFSKSALNTLNQRAKDKGLASQITTEQVDFEDFSINESGFDLIIDRLSVSHTSGVFAKEVFKRAATHLKNDGHLLSVLFSSGHSDKNYGRKDPSKEIWTDFSGGIFEGLLAANFYDQDDVMRLFEDFHIESLRLETDKDVLTQTEAFEVWKILAKKK